MGGLNLAPGPPERKANTSQNKAKGNPKAQHRRELVAIHQEVRHKYFRPDEDQNQRQRIFQIMETMHHRGQRKVQGTQA